MWEHTQFHPLSHDEHSGPESRGYFSRATQQALGRALYRSHIFRFLIHAHFFSDDIEVEEVKEWAGTEFFFGGELNFKILLQTTSEVGRSPNAKHLVMFILHHAGGDHPGTNSSSGRQCSSVFTSSCPGAFRVRS